MATQILSSLPYASFASEPTITATYGLREESPCLQVFVWPAGAATPIHDHTSWGPTIVSSVRCRRSATSASMMAHNPARRACARYGSAPYANRMAPRRWGPTRRAFTESATPVAGRRYQCICMALAKACSMAVTMIQRANLCATGWKPTTCCHIRAYCVSITCTAPVGWLPSSRGKLDLASSGLFRPSFGVHPTAGSRLRG
jgi:hypothetical protein